MVIYITNDFRIISIITGPITLREYKKDTIHKLHNNICLQFKIYEKDVDNPPGLLKRENYKEIRYE